MSDEDEELSAEFADEELAELVAQHQGGLAYELLLDLIQREPPELRETLLLGAWLGVSAAVHNAVEQARPTGRGLEENVPQGVFDASVMGLYGRLKPPQP